jgi:DNA ligase-1
VPDEILPFVTGLLAGYVFPKWTEKELGIGPKLLLKVISKITGITEEKVEKFVYSAGDFGEGIEKAIEHANAEKNDKNFVLSNIFVELAKV